MSFGYPDRRLRSNECPLTSVVCSNDDNGWPIHSLILFTGDLSGLQLRRLPPTVSCSMIIDSVSRQHTWPSHDNLRRLLVENESYWRPARISTGCHTYCVVLFVLYTKHSPVAFVFKGLDSKNCITKLTDASSVMVADRLMSSAMLSSNDCDRPAHYCLDVILPWFTRPTFATTAL